MVRNLVRFFLVFLLLSPFAFAAQGPETLTLDNQHSYVLWSIKHLGFSTQTGKWYVDGQVLLDEAKPQNSKVTATIKLAEIVTGIPELDKHLKGKQFFDVEQFPTAKFVSDKVEIINKNAAKVQGILSLHGVSKPVTLDVTLNKVGKNPINDRMTAGFTASTTIKRSDFGMNTLLPDLGDEVEIKIGAEAYKPNDQGGSDATQKQ